MVQNMYKNDPWMQFGLIQRESDLAAHFFQWSQQIFEFIQISKYLSKIGITELEEKINQTD